MDSEYEDSQSKQSDLPTASPKLTLRTRAATKFNSKLEKKAQKEDAKLKFLQNQAEQDKILLFSSYSEAEMQEHLAVLRELVINKQEELIPYIEKYRLCDTEK